MNILYFKRHSGRFRRITAARESQKWQDKWNMTNKEGERLSSGEYQVKISVLAAPLEKNEKIAESRLMTIISFDLGAS